MIALLHFIHYQKFNVFKVRSIISEFKEIKVDLQVWSHVRIVRYYTEEFVYLFLSCIQTREIFFGEEMFSEF